MRGLEFVETALHGCAHDLRDSKGNFMNKPWTITSASLDVTEGLERRCDGAHEHVHIVVARAAERVLSPRRRPVPSSDFACAAA
eukprot:8001513-Pyramimonas_sp.AAC.1